MARESPTGDPAFRDHDSPNVTAAPIREEEPGDEPGPARQATAGDAESHADLRRGTGRREPRPSVRAPPRVRAPMRLRGLEPPRGCPHRHLKPARLPIPPQPRAARR